MKPKCEKPKTMKAQVDALWDAVYNHLPSRLGWIDMKINFILSFLALVLALIALLVLRS